jgi:uncharacterized NAD(P)/FAD-binding protein YdhS
MTYFTHVAIIGGGLTGATAAIQLLRTIDRPFDLTIVEPEERLGCGLAYGRAQSYHLLNVRAGKLGVIHDQPNDFALWARDRSFGIRARPHQPEPARAFLPRRVFGAYVEERLHAAVSDRPDVDFFHSHASATRIRRSLDGFAITLGNGSTFNAEFVVLATGYGRASSASRLGRQPFAEIDPAEVRAARSALFVGTGLTFVDEFLRLRSLGFRGTALAISRRGLLPEVHRANETPTPITVARDANLRSLLKTFRTAMNTAEPPASAAVDLILGMREDAQRVWQSLHIREQRRFLKRLRPYWNAARHRLAPEIHAQIRHAMQAGMLRVAPGRLVDSDESPRVKLSRDAEGPFDLAFDCTGIRPEISNPLMTSLINHGLARPDAHGLGLMVASDGGMLTRGASRSSKLFALGPLGHGSLYEITAVPEIVAQSAVMAKSIRAELQSINPEQRLRREFRGAQARAG